MGKDLIYQALVNMGNASSNMAWANTCLEDVIEVSEKTKTDMKKINSEIQRLQEELRSVQLEKAKLEVGTRVLIKGTKNGCHGAEGLSGLVTNEQSTNGWMEYDQNAINVKTDYRGIWRVNQEAVSKELI